MDNAANNGHVDPGLVHVDPGLPGPGPFFGDGTQDAADWIRTFEIWTELKRLPEKTQVGSFSMLMKLIARRWFDTLSDEDRKDMVKIKQAFNSRFCQQDMWADFLQVGQIKQGPSEPAIQYLERCLALFKRVQISEQHQICSTIEGLRPQLQTFVIQQNAQNFEQLRKAALLAEKSVRPQSNEPNQSILQAVQSLESKFVAMCAAPQPTIAAMTDNATEERDGYRSRSRQRYDSDMPKPRQGHAIGHPRYASPMPNRASMSQRRSAEYEHEGRQCTRCLNFHQVNQCPFFNSTCFHCNKRGHIKRACKSNPQNYQYTH